MASGRPSFQIPARSFPTAGSKAMQAEFNFATVVLISGDFLLEMENDHIENIQSVKIDNSKNPAQFTIHFPGVGLLGDTIVVPPFTQGLYPITAPLGKLSYTASSTGGVTVSCTFYNIEQPYYQAVSISQTPTAGVITGTATNHSGNSAAANVSQIAIPANPNRLRAIIQNPQANNASFWIKEGTGNAATEDNLSQEIAPGQEYDTAMGPLQLGDINIISAVLNQTYFANEIHS